MLEKALGIEELKVILIPFIQICKNVWWVELALYPSSR